MPDMPKFVSSQNPNRPPSGTFGDVEWVVVEKVCTSWDFDLFYWKSGDDEETVVNLTTMWMWGDAAETRELLLREVEEELRKRFPASEPTIAQLPVEQLLYQEVN